MDGYPLDGDVYCNGDHVPTAGAVAPCALVEAGVGVDLPNGAELLNLLACYPE